MSQENVDFVRESYAALNDALASGEYLEAVQKFCDPDIVLKPAGLLPETTEMRGHAGMVQFLALQTQAFDAFHIETEGFIDAGDQVVVPIRFGGRANYSNLDVEFSVVHVCTTRDGKVTRIDMYLDKPEALAAVGLAE